MFLGELCHRQFFGNFTHFFRIVTFEIFRQLLQISPEIIAVSLLFRFNVFQKVCLHHKLGTCFLVSFDEKLFHDLEITKL